MENSLIISWNDGHGRMEIYMDKFFPCEQARFKKLLKIISLDWAHEEELKEELKVYFQNRIPNLPKEAEAKKKEAAEYRRKAAEAKKALNAEKKRIRSGGDPPYLEFRYDSEYRNNKYLAQEAEREAKKLLKSKQSFEKYLESM